MAPKPKKSRTIGSWDIQPSGAKLVALTETYVLNVSPMRAALSADGTYLYWSGSSYQDDMYRVRLRIPFAIQSADFSRFEAIAVPSLHNIGGFSFSPDGHYFVAMREGSESSGWHFSYRLTVPWDLKSAALISSRSFGNTGITERFLGVIQNGTRLLGDSGLVPATLNPPWRELSGGSNAGMDTARVYFETPDGKYRFSSAKNSDSSIKRERLVSRYGLDADEVISVNISSYASELSGKSIYGSFCFSLDGRHLYFCFTDRSVAQIRLRG